MVVDLENNKISICVKNAERTKLSVYAEIPYSASLWISFFKLYLQGISSQQISFSL